MSEVPSLTGECDPPRRVRVARHEQLAALVPRTIANLPGITRTRTFIAFEGVPPTRPGGHVGGRTGGERG